MICPFCNHDTNPINLNGKSFCENCGLSLGDSPKTTINNTSADSVIPELTTTHHLDTISAENHSERIRPIHENEVHEKVTQSAGINLNQKPPTDDKNIADLSKEPIAAPNPTSDERKISDLSQSIIKKPTEDEFLKELGVNNSDISTTKLVTLQFDLAWIFSYASQCQNTRQALGRLCPLLCLLVAVQFCVPVFQDSLVEQNKCNC